MKKAVKWFILILVMLLVVGVILFLCGFLKIKLKSFNGINVNVGVGDLNQGWIAYGLSSHDLTFNGFEFDFSRDDEYDDDTGLVKEGIEYERSLPDWDDPYWDDDEDDEDDEDDDEDSEEEDDDEDDGHINFD